MDWVRRGREAERGRKLCCYIDPNSFSLRMPCHKRGGGIKTKRKQDPETPEPFFRHQKKSEEEKMKKPERERKRKKKLVYI